MCLAANDFGFSTAFLIALHQKKHHPAMPDGVWRP
jgi:hypothetical protein